MCEFALDNVNILKICSNLKTTCQSELTRKIAFIQNLKMLDYRYLTLFELPNLCPQNSAGSPTGFQ